MAIQLKLQQKMSQQLVMTPQLQQAIKLLQLGHLEIAEELRKELEENPILEERQDGMDDGMSGIDNLDTSVRSDSTEAETQKVAEAPEPKDNAQTELLTDLGKTLEENQSSPEPTAKEVEKDVDWDNYADSYEYALPSTASHGSADDLPSIEATVSAPTGLVDHMRFQIQMADFSEIETTIAVLLVEELNEDGYLQTDSVDAVLEELEEYGVTRDQIERVVVDLQAFEPTGVCSFTIRECLLRQIQSQTNPDPIAVEIIDKFLPEVEKRQFDKIAKKLKVPLEEIGESFKLIGQLEPRPGNAYSSRQAQYVAPDIYVKKINDEWVISHNEEGIPKLRISGFYKTAMGKSGGQDKAYLQDKMRSAAWLIRSIHMRRRTLHKVMDSILKFQADFFEIGPTHLKPLILKDVAEDVEMHESTISRVTTNKYVHTPRGTFELKYFFNSSINRSGGDTIASESVRNRIGELISNENPKKPLSDQALVKMLQEFDIKIARRTVAKYREMLKIPPSSKRKQVF